MSSGLMGRKLSGQTDHCYKRRGKTNKQTKNPIIPIRKQRGGSIMLWGCCAAGQPGALHKADREEENPVGKLKLGLQRSAGMLKISPTWVLTPRTTSILPTLWCWRYNPDWVAPVWSGEMLIGYLNIHSFIFQCFTLQRLSGGWSLHLTCVSSDCRTKPTALLSLLQDF